MMGFDPISIGLIYGAGTALAGPGAGLIAAGGAAIAGAAGAFGDGKDHGPVNKQGLPATPQDGTTDAKKAVRKYRPAAQLFKDEDLKLGAAGKLGM